MVRAVVLEVTPSQAYQSRTWGRGDRVGHLSMLDLNANADYEVIGNTVQFMDNTFGNNHSTVWIFGDGHTSTEKDPVHVFGQGTFEVMLIVFHDCDADTAHFTLHFTTATEAPLENGQFIISPNPSGGSFQINSNGDNHHNFDIEIAGMNGEIVFKEKGLNNGSIIHPNIPSGIYFVTISSHDRLSILKLMIH